MALKDPDIWEQAGPGRARCWLKIVAETMRAEGDRFADQEHLDDLLKDIPESKNRN
jgi:hypothetical protein